MIKLTNRTARNVLASFFGWGWTAVMGLVCFPIYVRFLGIEAFGLVSFFTVLQSTLVPLDLGLSTALSKELAGLSAQKGKELQMRELVRTLEVIYWAVAAVVGGGVLLLAPWISRYWVHADHVSLPDVRQAVALMGVALTLVWPYSLYSRGVMGLQQHVRLNVLNSILITARYLGAVPVIWWAPSVRAFFIWQIVAYGVHTGVVALLLWGSLPTATNPARFRTERLKELWRFVAGLSGISATAVVLAQMDRIILSKFLPLDLFGYYSLAALAAGSMMFLSEPVYAALLPRLSELVILQDFKGIRKVYHGGCQVLSAVVFPAMAIVCLYSSEVLSAWTGSREVVEHSHGILSLLIVAATLAALNRVPFALQLAHGWTGLAFRINLLAIVIGLPLMIIAAKWGDPASVALIVVLVNAAYTVCNLTVMHRALLSGDRARWYVEDVGYPLAVALLIAGAGRWLFPATLSRPLTVAALAAVASATLLASLFTAAPIREWVRRWMSGSESAEPHPADDGGGRQP
jgi:O-antigen/teichoic acid export membrane protein